MSLIDETHKDFKLCYVDQPWAWFTTADVTKQWGDDWDDVPYEHNAGTPYEWREGMSAHPKPYLLKKVAFESRYVLPNHGTGNSDFSVDGINRGDIAWLRDKYGDKPPIHAGTDYCKFVEMIHASGGTVYEAVERQDDELNT